MVADFVWDDGNKMKCQKHGVSLAEIEQVFRHRPLILSDRTGSMEVRFNAVGLNAEKRHIFIVFTLREKEKTLFIRPLSARYMHKKEINAYEVSKQT